LTATVRNPECPTLSAGTPTLRRYVNSRLYMQAMNVLREDDVNFEQVPDGVPTIVCRNGHGRETFASAATRR